MLISKKNLCVSFLRELTPLFSVDVRVKFLGKVVFHWHFPPDSESLSADESSALSELESVVNDENILCENDDQ